MRSVGNQAPNGLPDGSTDLVDSVDITLPHCHILHRDKVFGDVSVFHFSPSMPFLPRMMIAMSAIMPELPIPAMALPATSPWKESAVPLQIRAFNVSRLHNQELRTQFLLPDDDAHQIADVCSEQQRLPSEDVAQFPYYAGSTTPVD